jgi:hypothetical protein
LLDAAESRAYAVRKVKLHGALAQVDTSLFEA